MTINDNINDACPTFSSTGGGGGGGGGGEEARFHRYMATIKGGTITVKIIATKT